MAYGRNIERLIFIDIGYLLILSKLKYGGNIIEIWPTAEIWGIDIGGYWILVDIKKMKYGGNRSVDPRGSGYGLSAEILLKYWEIGV